MELAKQATTDPLGVPSQHVHKPRFMLISAVVKLGRIHAIARYWAITTATVYVILKHAFCLKPNDVF